MIVVALFIVALVATMAYVMMARLERDTRRTQLILRSTQADLYAQGSVLWAMDLLKNNYEKKKPDTLVDQMPVTSPVNTENGYRIQSTISDMQGRFNLNVLNGVEGMASFERLVLAVVPNLKEEEAKEVVRSVTEWVSSGQKGGSDQYYQGLSQPYRAAHRPMLTASEFRLVKGVSQPIFMALEPYIAALPVSAGMNVQTASAPVLMTISPAMTLDAAKAIVSVRAQKPFVTIEAFKKLDIVANHLGKESKSSNLTTISNYFLVETHVSVENQEIVLYTLLERATNGNKAVVTISWQSKGVM